VLDAQHAAHAAGVTAHAIADAVASCGRFDDVLGPALTAKSDARVLAFLDRAAHEGAALTGPAKTFWKRTRPYASSNLVERLADMAPDWKAPPSPDADAPCAGVKHPVAVKARRLSKAKQQQEQEKEKDKAQTQAQDLAHSSYPSGHSTFATVCAILLADMVPEKRAQLFARGRDFGHSRLVVGAHFPSDVEAGRITGTVATALMMQNAQFQHDYSEARVNLRAALGLPAASPPAAATPNLPTTAAGPSVGAANP